MVHAPDSCGQCGGGILPDPEGECIVNILITGAAGFVGKNLTAALQCIKDGKDRTHPGLSIGELYLYDIDSPEELLEEACSKADFVFNMAGVNRPQTQEEFMDGNFGFASKLLDTLKKYRNTCPVMLSSSIQATLIGRYASGEYGKSKKAGEDLFFAYGQQTGAKVLVYRFPNLFGKWCRPNYNSAVATFCHNYANDLPITVNDASVQLELLYIDDLVEEMIAALEGREHRCEFDGVDTVLTEDGRYCAAPVTHKVTLGEIVALLDDFKAQPQTLLMPEIPHNSFAKKLYSTYLSYLPKEKAAFPLKMNCDARGSFTELLRTEKCGQFSVNVSLPGITKGQHWHHTKWEFFIVVAGHGLIQQRKVGSDEVLNFEVSGDKIEAVHMLPGYTHNIINLSETENLVTVMWANECFDPNKPDTFFEKVEQ
ncbi:MAG: NAD-dependent epimerase/dehydratase family protein [Oscillospiraceae bacterium]|nr:NAD-dependent epimerase/dehydratase family protein [Oscillospiraceae bacterium]